MTCTPNSSSPSASAGDSWCIGTEISSDARSSKAGSPVGSAAARSSSRCASVGSCCTRRRKLASIRSGSDPSLGSPKPPASPCAENSRGSSSSASGLPRVSASIRARTRSSRGVVMTDASSSRADRPPARRSAVQAAQPAHRVDQPLVRRTAGRPTRPLSAEPRTPALARRIDQATGHRRPGTPRMLARGVRQQAEHGQPDEQSIWRRARAHPNAVASASRCGAATARCSDTTRHRLRWCRAARMGAASVSRLRAGSARRRLLGRWSRAAAVGARRGPQRRVLVGGRWSHRLPR